MILASALVPKAVDTIGKKHAYLLAGVIAVASAVGFAVAPASAPATGIVCYGVLGIGLGTINTLIFALQADTVDYGEWNSGIRAEGGSYSVLSFTRKTGQGIGGAVAAYTIGLGGYIATAKTQSRLGAHVDPGGSRDHPGRPLPRRSSRHAGLPADREGLPRHRG